ncbi:MAG: small ribosomal subunit Rsm22 family protein [Clostridia bacterium]
MNLPNKLLTEIEHECEKINHAKLVSYAQNLSLRYRTESGHSKRLLTNKDEALAYAISRMPATYGSVFSALEKTLSLLNVFPCSLIDAGAGTGTATFASDNLLNLKEITCLEREESMIQIGQKLLSGNLKSLASPNWIKFDFLKDEIKQKAELVIVSYVLNELSSQDRIMALDKLWNSTTSILLIVDSGTPTAFQNLKETRKYLLNKGAYLIAPCSHTNDCPLGANDWCHFSCRIQRTKLHKILKGGEAPFEDEAFTYLAFSKTPAKMTEKRVLRHPQIKPKVITFSVCTSQGIKQLTYSKKDGEAYKLAKKVSIGDEL